MNAQVKQPSLLGRAARMLLVFLLVFGMSFRVEMALANSDIETSNLKDHEKGTLVDLAVCKVVKDASTSKLKPDVNNSTGKVRSLTEMLEEKNKDGLTLAYGESVQLAAAPKWKDEKFDESAAEYVEWKIDDKDKKNEAGKYDPILEIKNDGTLGSSVTITCSLSKDAKDYLSDALQEVAEITFPIKMKAAPHQAVSEPKIVLTGAGLIEGENSLHLSAEQGKSYQFGAKVSATVLTVDGDGATVDEKDFSYTSTNKETLAKASDGLFNNLQWALYDKNGDELAADIASIDQNGLLKVSKESVFTVSCTLATADGQSVVPFELALTCGNPSESGEPESPEDPADKKPDQGADHRQDSLQITGRVATSAMASGVTAADPAGSSSGSASSGSASSGSASGSSSAESAAEKASGSSSSSDPSSSSASSSSSANDATKLDKTYSLADIEALPSEEQTFTVNSLAAGVLTVTGKGPTLETLFKNLGIENLDAVYQLKFTDYAEGEITLDWKDLSGAMLAVKSFVHDPAKGAQTNESPSVSTSNGSDEITLNSDEANNTRFRILAQSLSSDSVDADSLRWIKSIEINPGSKIDPTPEPEPDPEAPFTVSISYAPSPIGQECVFWPIPSKEIANATFDYTWEESSDGGASWKTVSESPTYRTITTQERIGHLFRVILSSDMTDETTGKKLKATSEPEAMKEGSGFSLIYDPPLAGGVAMFIVEMKGKIPNLDINKLDYIWELSTDGCETWQKLADQYQGKSTLSIQTDPIDKNSSSDDVTPVYIRARVIEQTGDKRAFVAGPQMLTVRTGDESGDGDDKKNQAPNNAVPVTTVKDDANQQKQSKKKTKKEKKQTNADDSVIGDDELEYEGEGDEDITESSEGGSADKKAAPQLHINDGVTEQILKQEAAAQERMEQTVPGARWTSLNMTQASGDDVRNILAENPFAPFAIPVGLGIAFAGGLEKLLTFRRQL